MATNRRSAAARARSAAAAGSASAILATTSASNRPHGNAPRYSVVCSSTQPACSHDSSAAAHSWATFRACHTRPTPASSAAHSSGCRSRTLTASRIRWSPATCPIPCNAPSSAAANSATRGVPCAPARFARSIPGRTRTPRRARSPSSASPQCRSAQCAANANSSNSARTRSACSRSTAAHAPSASRSLIHSPSGMARTYLRTPTLSASRTTLWKREKGSPPPARSRPQQPPQPRGTTYDTTGHEAP